MISLAKFKELLGDEAQGLTDKDIEHIRDAQHQFAMLAFEKWVAEKALTQRTTQKSNNMV